ncbi:Leucyl aminopeptidase yscIV [Tulasnella sp. 418]|nr:Leucyl aminopeptidase yscIV [Tulasnella sp. 418]
MKVATSLAGLTLCAASVRADIFDWLPNWIPKPLTPSRYQEAVTLEGLLTHAKKWQQFASAPGANSTRVFGSQGYNASVDYVTTLTKKYGYKVTQHIVQYPRSDIFGASLNIDGKDYKYGPSLAVFSYSPPTPGILTGPLVLISDKPGGAEGAGCEPADYAGIDVKGKVVFVARGSCTFAIKSQQARNAGAAAAIIYNNVPNQGVISSRVNVDVTQNVPTVMISLEDATPLVARLNSSTPETIQAALSVQSQVKNVYSANVIAQTRWGNDKKVIQIGAHLDSVPAGPGINDDGSGSATVLELAKQLSLFIPPRDANAVRFSWWTAEEIGLVGSAAYVASLSQVERDKIAVYINLDMTASPNGIYGIHDGDNSEGANTPAVAPAGSAALEKLFQADFDSKKVPHASYAFSGSSDYDAFLNAGIPAGGIATGAGGIKTPEQAAVFGGTAGVAFDKNYHQAGDTIDNLWKDGFLVNARSVANVVAQLVKSLKPIEDEKSGAKTSKIAPTSTSSTKSNSFGLVDLGKTCLHDHDEL